MPTATPKPEPAPNPPVRPRITAFGAAHIFAQAVAIGVIVLGLAVLAGWAVDNQNLKSVFPGFVSMKPNDAICFALSGIALLFGFLLPPAPWKKKVCTALAGIVLLISGATLLEYLTGISLGLDAIFFHETSNTALIPHPGRMASTTALDHVLFAAALILLSRGARGILIGQMSTVFALFMALMSLVGYIFASKAYVSEVGMTHTALHTAVGFWMLGLGILCARPRKGLMTAVMADSPAGVISRRLIIPSIIMPLGLGWLAFLGHKLGYYDWGFAASLIVVSSMIVICILAWRSIHEMTRIENERRKLSQQQLHADAREVGVLEASRLKSEFVANVSHEIRTPMNGVLGMTSLLLDSHLTAEQREHVETIRQSGDALLSLVNEILDFSKIEAGKIVLEQKPFALATCVDEVINLLALAARKNRVNLVSFIEPHVLPIYNGDASRVRQILLNLIGNAVKFTEAGEVTLQVNSAPIDDNLYRLEFTVTDTGTGISPEALSKLFQPFQQGDASATRKYGGTGLGLTISKSLVQLMGGEISVSSVVGSGSVFKFWIPLRNDMLEGYTPEDRLPPTAKFVIVAQGGRYPTMLKNQIEAWGGVVTAVVDPVTLLKMTQTDVTAILMDRDDDTIALAAQLEFDPDWKDVPRMLLDFGQDVSEERMKLFAKRLLKPVKRSHLLVNLVELAGGEAAAPRMTIQIALKPMSEKAPLRILLTEDNHINQKVGIALLSRLGYRADVASNGLEAVDAVTRQTYDLILMDIQMPEMDGIEATKAIRAKLGDKAPKIVALTANASHGARDEYMAQGFDDYLSKPILPPALRQMITRVVKTI